MATRLKKHSQVWLFCAALLLAACGSGNVRTDVQADMPRHAWSYPNKVAATTEIDSAGKYNVHFMLRVTAEYRYSNIYVLFKVKDPKGHEVVRRYGFKLAEADGQWTGKGSGNLYAYKLGLFTNRTFPQSGKYTFTVEQNMRDNPLTGISDAGLLITQQEN